MAGAPVRMRSTATAQGPRAPTLVAMFRSRCSRRSITAGSSSRIWNSISAFPGMMLGAPGSSVMLPVVHTVRGPQTCGKRSSISTQNFASASPASLRSAIRVVPAWFCSPVKVIRYCQMPTMEVTTPIAERAALQRPALLDMGLQISDMAAAFGLRARPAGKACLAQRVAHGSIAVAVARGVDVAPRSRRRHRTGCRGSCRNGLPRRTMTQLRRRLWRSGRD